GSGYELASAETLASYLEGPGIDLETYEPLPGRASLVARIEGREPGHPSLLLMGHTDVVPANPDNWLRDPFGGELVDGEVWGRGAVDMLCLTASMAVTVRRLADQGFRPAGTLIYLAVADEEAGGRLGAEWLIRNRPDVWRRFVEGMELPADAAASLLDPSRIEDTCASHPDPGWARLVHASTHTSIAPTVLRTGIKTNVIPDRAELQVDIRTLPGQGEDEVRTMLAEALGDLHDAVEIVVDTHDPATASPLE